MKLTHSRIRKVKCDETRPSCRKCTESGRQCEGPSARQFHFVQDQHISRSSTPTPQPEVSLLAPQHNQAERRAFHYFTHRAAPIFAGAVDARFWKALVPQLAQRYGFVWDTVVCLSYLLERIPAPALRAPSHISDLTKSISQEHRQALSVYHRAIVSVRKLADRDDVDDSFVVFSYILFATVEFQQRNVKTGTDLLKKCCRILTEDLTARVITPKSTAGQAIHAVITPFVLRRAVLMGTLGNALPPQWVGNDEASESLEAVLSRSPVLNEARNQFHSLVNDCYELVRLEDFVLNVKDDDPGKVSFLSRCQSLVDKFVHWKTSFTATSSCTPNVETDWIGSYLLMYWAVCYTSLVTCASLLQTVFDDHRDQFADIVEHATIYIRHCAQSIKVQQLSSFTPGAIPPLYFCATKCRDPTLRREALRLMREAPGPEKLWAFVAPDRVVAKVISVEEGECQLSSRASERAPYNGLPPEENRFAYVGVVARQAPCGKQRQALELSRFEFAEDGSRRLINDYVWLNEGDEVWRDAQSESEGMATRNLETYLDVWKRKRKD